MTKILLSIFRTMFNRQSLIGMIFFSVGFLCNFFKQKPIPDRFEIIQGVFFAFAIALFLGFSSFTKPSKPITITAVALSIIFSQFLCLGYSFENKANWSLCFGSTFLIVIWILQSICFSIAIYPILLRLYGQIESCWKTNKKYSLNLWNWFWVAIVVRICFFIAFYPCVFGFDAAVSLRTCLDPNSAICDHHPFFTQLIIKGTYILGKTIGHISVGFAMLTICWIFISCLIIKYCITTIKKTNIGSIWVLVATITYVLFPLFPYLSIWPTKDGFFSYFFLFYLSTLLEIFTSKGLCLATNKNLLLHSISILAICLTRHQGIIIVVIEACCLVYLYHTQLIKILLATATPLVIVLSFSRFVLPALNVEPGGKQEVFGTLFQQTAFYAIKHPDDITKEDSLAINAILNIDIIKDQYDPYRTDHVKRIYKYNPRYSDTKKGPSKFCHIDRTNEISDLANYLYAWGRMFVRHPLTYIEATTSVCCGFFYDIDQLLILAEPEWAEKRQSIGPYNFYHVDCIASFYSRHIDSWLKIPIIKFILTIPLYSWIALLLVSVLFYRKDKPGVLLFLPFILSLLILCICPISFGRYIFPIVISLPLLFTYLITTTHKSCQE